MYKVMIRDNMSLLAKEILEDTGQIEVVVDFDKETSKPEKLVKLLDEFDGLAIRSGTKVPAEVIEQVSRLKCIGRAGIGVDNIDVSAATKKGIVVMNAPGGNTVTTAEHAISMLCALARHIPQATASLREGKWDKKKFVGVEISDKTLGIIGLGQIGRVVADRANGLKMHVIASDPFVSKEAAEALKVELVDTDELLRRSDFITLHVPRMDETRGMVNEEFLKKTKQGVRLINCSRGEVVNVDDLYKYLESGHVAGAALDVFPTEPPEADLPILRHPNVIMTPHLGASTGEAQEKVAEMIAKQMAGFLIHGSIVNAVNFPSISPKAMEELRPYIRLAEKMGSMMGQLVRELSNVTITYAGEVAELDIRPITHAILKGLLGAYTDQPVNYVNAPALAKSKGMKVEEKKSRKTHDYTTLIKLDMVDNTYKLSDVWGTIFGKDIPRIVRLGRIYMDAIPEGPMLIIQNKDKPGVIGNIGTALAENKINIGRFHLGRREGQALCMVNVDSLPDDEVVEKLRVLPNIISVRRIHLD